MRGIYLLGYFSTKYEGVFLWKYGGDSPSAAVLAEGLSGAVASGLGKVSYLN